MIANKRLGSACLQAILIGHNDISLLLTYVPPRVFKAETWKFDP